MRSKGDIICLQETHSEYQSEQIWENEWGGRLFCSHGTSSERGVAIHLPKNTEIEVEKICKDEDGRMLILQVQYKEVKFIVANIYAPNIDEPDIFLKVFCKIEELDGYRIMVGDFNLALNNEIDSNDKESKNNANASEALNSYLIETHVIDVWRDRYEFERKYTFKSKIRGKNVMSRIDYILVESAIVGWVDKINILPGFRSDHSAVLCVLSPYNVKKGKAIWRFNNSLLEEIEFVNQMNKVIAVAECDAKSLN